MPKPPRDFTLNFANMNMGEIKKECYMGWRGGYGKSLDYECAVDLFNDEWKRGENQFLSNISSACPDSPYRLDDPRRYPFDQGFSQARIYYFKNKYKYDELRKKIIDLIESYGLTYYDGGCYDPSSMNSSEGYSEFI